MAAADRIVGTAVEIKFTPSGGTQTDIHPDYTTFSINESTDTVDVTAGNETSRYHKATIGDADFSLSMFFANQTYFTDLAPQTEGLLEIFPEGDSVGEAYASMNVLLLTRNTSLPFDGAVEVEVTGRKQGDWVQAPWGAVSA